MNSTLIEHINKDTNKLAPILKLVYTYTVNCYMFRPTILPSSGIHNTDVRYIKNKKINIIYKNMKKNIRANENV